MDDEEVMDEVVEMLSAPVQPFEPRVGSVTSIKNLEDLGLALRESLFGMSAGSGLENLRIRETVARFILVRPLSFFSGDGINR